MGSNLLAQSLWTVRPICDRNVPSNRFTA